MRVILTTLNAKYIHSSLALRYLWAVGRSFPIEQEVLEFTINDLPASIAAEIYRHHPEIVAFSCYIWNIKPSLEVAGILKKVRPELLIVFGGPEVSFESEALLKANPQVDLIIRGEGELAWAQFLSALLEEAPPRHPVTDLTQRLSPSLLTSLPGLVYRKGADIFSNGWAPVVEDLDSLPDPYPEDTLVSLKERTVYYETSRGCPFGCGFCLSSTTSGVRYFSLERVKEDIRRLLKAGVREIKFVDRTFNAHKERALSIWEFLITEPLISLNPKPKFYFEIVGDLLDEEMLNFLKDIPPDLFQFEIGVQTINEEVNLRCQRRQNWKKLARNIKKLRSMGNIRLHLDLIAGLPGETYSSFAQSFDAVYTLRPHEIQLGFLKLLKGTPLRQEAFRYGYVFLEDPPYEVLASRDMSYAELLRLHRIAELLERYWNSHIADHALCFLEQAFPTPFNLFETLASWWEEKGFHRRAPSRQDLYNNLARFAATFRTKIDLNLFYHLLKFDLCLHDRSRRWPSWAPPSPLTEKERSLWMDRLSDQAFRRKHLPELLSLDPTTLRRHGYLELFPCHPERPLEKQPTLVYFYYGPPGTQTKARVYYLSRPFDLNSF